MINLERHVHEEMDRIEQESPTVLDALPVNDDPNNCGYEDYADDEIIDTSFATHSGDMLTDKPEEIAEILTAYFKRVHGKNGDARYMNYMANVVVHERQHGEVMDEVGVEDIRYGVRILRNYNSYTVDGKETFVADWKCQPFTTAESPFRLPKILYAMVFAYPTEPSSGDKVYINQLGYQNAHHVYARSLGVRGVPHIKPLSLR